MKVPVTISNRHVHLTEEDYLVLFGNEILEKDRDLNQPGQYASTKKVTIQTEKNKIEKVRVIGPFRTYTQVEISKTDSYKLGLNPPVRTSGDLNGAEPITIIGPMGEITKNCAIIADRHIHVNEQIREEHGLVGVEKVSIKVSGEKGGIIDNVYLKDNELSYYELHLDTDDANSHLIKSNDELEIIL